MPQRAYTVAEIDALRQALENKYVYGTYSAAHVAGGRFSRSYFESDKIKAVEEMTRTHMLAGHTAQDLYASETPER